MCTKFVLPLIILIFGLQYSSYAYHLVVRVYIEADSNQWKMVNEPEFLTQFGKIIFENKNKYKIEANLDTQKSLFEYTGFEGGFIADLYFNIDLSEDVAKKFSKGRYNLITFESVTKCYVTLSYNILQQYKSNDTMLISDSILMDSGREAWINHKKTKYYLFRKPIKYVVGVPLIECKNYNNQFQPPRISNRCYCCLLLDNNWFGIPPLKKQWFKLM